MTLQAKSTCPQLDGGYQSISFDVSGGTRHICSRKSLVGVPGSFTPQRTTGQLFSDQTSRGKDHKETKRWKWIGFLLSYLIKNETLTLMYIVQKQWSNCGLRRRTWRLNSPRGWLPQRTSPSHYSHGILLITKKSPTILKYFLFCEIFRCMPC